MLLNCSLTSDALFWLIDKFHIINETKIYEQTIDELKQAFLLKDITAFRTEFYL